MVSLVLKHQREEKGEKLQERQLEGLFALQTNAKSSETFPIKTMNMSITFHFSNIKSYKDIHS